MSKKESMDIKEFNEINTSLSELLDKLSEYEHVDITEARKQLKQSGKKISEFYFRIFNSDENGTKQKTPTND